LGRETPGSRTFKTSFFTLKEYLPHIIYKHYN